jgi:hypothetical protein
LGCFKETPVTSFRRPQSLLHLLALSDVVNCEEYQICTFTLPIDPPSIEKHPSQSEARKFVVNFEIIEVGILGDNFLQQLSKSRDVPLVVAYTVTLVQDKF